MVDEDVAVPVEVLTDEELAVLDRGDGMVVTPHMEGLDAGTLDTVLLTAYRGLRARGILEPPTPEACLAAVGQPTVELQVREDVQSLVTLRRAADVVVAVARTTVVGQDYWYAHVVGDVALLEQVDADGIHRFALTRTPDLARLAVEAAVHPECGDATGEVLAMPAGQGDLPLPVAERLGASILRADLVVRSAGDGGAPVHGVFTGPGGAWVVSAEAGTCEDVTVRPVTAGEVRRLVHDVVQDGVARRSRAHDRGGVRHDSGR